MLIIPIIYGAIPSLTGVVLNSTFGTNLTTENLTVHWDAADSDGDSVKGIVSWYLNGTSIVVLNMPFEGGSNSSNQSSVTDYSGFGSNGTNQGSVTWNSTGGYDGKGAFVFDGIDDRISLPIVESLNFTIKDFSFSAWVKPAHGNSDIALIGVGNPYGSNGKGWLIDRNVAGGGATGQIRLVLNNGSGASLIAVIANNNILETAWHHVVITADRDALATFYIDGESIGTQNISSKAVGDFGTDDIEIGKYGSLTGFNWNGSMDEVMLFSRVLSKAQVKALYQNRTYVLTSNETNKNDQWQACVTPNDGSGDGTMVCSGNLTILNAIPNIVLSLEFSDVWDKVNSNLTGSWTFTDGDGDAELANETRWYNNSIESVNLRNVTSINSSLTTSGENWTFSARVYDGDAWSGWINISRLVQQCNNNSACEPGNGENYTNCPNDCSQGQIGYWSFDSTHRNSTHVFDQSGNNFDGTIISVNFTTGIRGDALSLNGINNSVVLPDVDNLSLFGGVNGTLTVSAVVKTSYIYRNNAICAGCGPINYFIFGDPNQYMISMSRNYTTSQANIFPISYSSIQNDQWTRVSLVIEGAVDYKYYVNCKLNKVVDNPHIGLYQFGGASVIGKLNSNSTYFDGMIDELKIWNRTLTAQELSDECGNLDICGNDVCSSNESIASCPSDCISLGCVNNETAECIDFGSANDLGGNISVVSNTSFSANSTDSGISYRNLTSQNTVDIRFPAFNNDSDGLPLSPMALEIKYKDTFDSSAGSRNIKVISLINYSGSNVNVLGLEGYKNNNWNTRRAIFQNTSLPTIKVVNNTYQFRFTMPSVNIGNISIDYIALHKVNQSVYDAIGQYQRDILGFKRYDKPLTGNITSVTWFTKNPSEPVYETTTPNTNEINQSIYKRMAKGEISSVSFSVRSPYTIGNVEVNASNLTCRANNSSTVNLTIYQVIQSLKTWTSYRSWPYYKTYGQMPDRVETFSNTTIEANKTKSFWVTASVSGSSTACNYTGSITVYNNSEKLFNLSLTIGVMNFSLDQSNTSVFIYATPTSESSNVTKLYENVQNHQVSIKWPTTGTAFITIINNGTNITGYNFTSFETELDTLRSHGLLSSKHFLDAGISNSVLSTLGITTGTLYEKLSNQTFVNAYGLYIQGMNALASARGVEFVYSVTDEPGTQEDRRTEADRLYRIIRNNNGKTWVTYTTAASEELNGTGAYLPTNTTLPDLGTLLDYKVYILTAVNSSEAINNAASFGYYTTYYSNLRNPIYNRFLAGYYAHRTAAKVVAVYAYGTEVNDYYNDFDQDWNDVPPAGYYDFILAYPSWNGNMTSTMAFEGLREGVNDMRYINTLSRLINEKSGTSNASEANTFLTSRFANLSYDWNNNYSNQTGDFGFDHVIVSNLSTSGNSSDYQVFDDIRSTIADYILQLQAVTIPAATARGTADPAQIYSEAFGFIKKQNLITINPSGVRNVKQIKFKTKTDLKDQKITIEEVSSAPETSGNRWHSFFKIDAGDISQNIETADIYYVVDKEWLTREGLSQSDIALYSWNGNEWKEYSSGITSSDKDNYYYLSTVDHFSYFGIGLKGQAEELAKSKSKKIAPEEPCKEAPKEKIKEPNFVNPSSIRLYIIGIITLIVMLGLTIILTRKKLFHMLNDKRLKRLYRPKD